VNIRRLAGQVVAGAVFVAAVTGCAVGQGANTSKAHTAIDGVNVDLSGGQLQVRNVYLVPIAPNDIGNGVVKIPKGGGVKLYAHIFNNGTAADALVAVDCLNGGVTTITGPNPGTSPIEQGQPNRVELPAQRLVKIGYPDTPQVEIKQLGIERFVGTYLKLRLSFENAGSVTIDAPIKDAPTEEAAAA
jgi:hypothetical protein